MCLFGRVRAILNVKRTGQRTKRGRKATGDAAKTGILLGQTAALCGILVPFLENTFDLRDIHVRADPDFEKDKTEWAAEVFCAIRPITFIRIAFRHRKPLRRLYELLKQGVKA